MGQSCIGSDQCGQQAVHDSEGSCLLQTQQHHFAKSVVHDEVLDSDPGLGNTVKSQNLSLSEITAKPINMFVAANGGSNKLPNGNQNPGTNKYKPLDSVQGCIDRLKTAPDASTCKLLGGTYRLDTPVLISGFQNGDSKEITAADPEKGPVTFDGTREVPKNLWEWEKPSPTGCPRGCYSAKLPKSIQNPWQLFLGDEMFINARWPNAHWKDKSLFDATKSWGFSSDASTFTGPSKCARDPNPGANKCTFNGMQWTFNTKTKKCEDDTKMECRNAKKGGMVPNTKPGECEMHDATPDHPETGSKTLGDENFDATGASVVLNVGHWVSYAGKVKAHRRKSSSFKYDSRSGWNVLKFIGDHTIYYLENSIQLLDIAGEWFFDPNDSERRVYIKTENDKDPKTFAKPITVRVQDYAFKIEDASNVKLSHMKFFATTLLALAKDKDTKVTDLTFDSLTFDYPSAAKRMLGDVDHSHPTTITNHPTFAGSVSNTIENCIFRYSEASPTLELSHPGFTIRNNLFEYIDWSAVSTITPATIAHRKGCSTPGSANGCFSGGAATLDLPAGSAKAPLIFERNTVRFHGASNGPNVMGKGENNKFTLNHIYGKKDLQLDGGLISIPAGAANGVVISKNWVHDSLPPRHHAAKWGLRFDRGQSQCGENWGINGELSRNVVFNTNGINVKGNSHKIIQNTVMWSGYDPADDPGTKAGARDINLYGSDGGIGTCECTDADCKSRKKTCCVSGDKKTFENKLSDVSGNLMGQCSGAFGGGKWRVKTDEVDEVYKVQGVGTVSWNSGAMASEELRDPENLDFRPVKAGVVDKLCIGAYKDVGKGGEYWIPGHQELIATTPVPPHQSTTVKQDAHLMFKPARGAVRHFVYAALSWDALSPTKKYPAKKLRQAVLTAPANVVQPRKWIMKPKKPKAKPVFWRVDAKYKDGSIKVGKVWKFTVAPAAPQASSCVSFSTKGPLSLNDAGFTTFDLKVPSNGGRPAWEVMSSAEICIKASHTKDMGSLEFRFVNKGSNKVLAKKEGHSSKTAEGCFVDVAGKKSFPKDQGPWTPADKTGTIFKVLQDQGITSKEQTVQLKIKDHDRDGKTGTLDSWSVKLCYDQVKVDKVLPGVKGMCPATAQKK